MSEEQRIERSISRRRLLQSTGGAAAALTLPEALPRPATATAASSSAVWDTMSDTWVGTDGLGRRLPTHEEVGDPRPDRFVGLFYFLWLGQHSTTGPWDITKILDQYPEARDDKMHPAWGPMGHFHHWGEPLFGYYLSDDRYVIRQHAHMLIDAGIDVIIFDLSNNFTYRQSYSALLETFAEVRRDGGTTPQVAFLTPFSSPQQVVTELYRDLYQPGLHEDLWFRWNGKPLIMADPAGIGLTLLTGRGSDPSRLESGRTLGQTFTVTEPFLAVGGWFPTWFTTDSDMTLSLFRDGPGGELLAEQWFENVPDNATMKIDLDVELPAGTYYLEQSEPNGTIGWWTVPDDVYSGGQAYIDGNPVMGDRSLFVGFATGTAREISQFFTFRKPQPSYFVGPTGPNQWSWLEVHPQHVFHDAAGNAEQMAVGVAQNAVDGRLGAMSEPAAQGRSFHDGTLPTDTSRTAEGLNFREQWDRALAEDPEFIFVTEWNEWVAQRFDHWHVAEGEVIFVDQFDWEHSRGIEPMVGGHGDAYYYQLVANVRRFKGVRPVPRASEPASPRIDGHFGDWTEVGPEFRDHIGDTVHRDHPGWGDAGQYINRTGRNDIVAAKVARDAENVYFYVRTRDRMTPPTDRNWMMLFLDVTGDPETGWEGFDFVINHRIKNERRTYLEASTGGWHWRTISEVRYAVDGTEMELAIPRRLLGLDPAEPLWLEFKWIDNMQREGDILDVIDSGDAAPSGRFRYRCQE